MTTITTAALPIDARTCPRWCEGHSAGNPDEHSPFHRSRSWSWDTSLGVDCIVEMEQLDGEAASVHIRGREGHPDIEGTTPQQIMDLALALIEAHTAAKGG